MNGIVYYMLIFFNGSRMTIQELGSSDVVLDLLAQRLSRKPSELKVNTCVAFYIICYVVSFFLCDFFL